MFYRVASEDEKYLLFYKKKSFCQHILQFDLGLDAVSRFRYRQIKIMTNSNLALLFKDLPGVKQW